MKIYGMLCIACLFAGCFDGGQISHADFETGSLSKAQISIIPEPVKLTSGSGSYKLSPQTVIFTDASTVQLGKQFSKMLDGCS